MRAVERVTVAAISDCATFILRHIGTLADDTTMPYISVAQNNSVATYAPPVHTARAELRKVKLIL